MKIKKLLMLKRLSVISLLTLFSAIGANSQEKEDVNYLPEVHGTLRAKYEYQTEEGENRFEVRTARLSVNGKVAKVVEYKAGKTDDNATKVAYYLQSAKMGYVPAIDKVIELVDYTNASIQELYNELVEIAETGDDSAIIAMNKLEKKYNDMLQKLGK